MPCNFDAPGGEVIENEKADQGIQNGPIGVLMAIGVVKTDREEPRPTVVFEGILNVRSRKCPQTVPQLTGPPRHGGSSGGKNARGVTLKSLPKPGLGGGDINNSDSMGHPLLGDQHEHFPELDNKQSYRGPHPSWLAHELLQRRMDRDMPKPERRPRTQCPNA